MFYKLLSRVTGIKPVSFKSSYTKLSNDLVAKDGVLCRTSIFKSFDTRETLGHITANDFKLDNILAIGAYDMLKPVYAPDTNNLNVALQVEQSLKELGHELSKEN